MKPLGGLDGAFLHLQTPQTPMHVALLHFFELPAGDAGDFHLQRVTLPAPGGQAELEACAARLHGELLDRSRPWWRLYIIDGSAGVIPPVAKLVISNDAGPQQPLYAAGARMRTCWPLSIPEHGLGLNMTVMSCAGEAAFGFTTAAVAVPHARALADALVEADGELRSCSRPHAPPRRPAKKAAGVWP